MDAEINGYIFKNINLKKEALTHSSIANETNMRSNERLEFLGDSVLGLIIGKELFTMFPDVDEGVLSKMRAHLVSEDALCVFAKRINLNNLICLGRGEEKTGGRKKDSLLADAFEAMLAAIYLDSDFDTAKKWVLDIMRNELSSISISDTYFDDYKTKLQELLQKDTVLPITYKLLSTTGPDHDKKFEVAVFLGTKMLATGIGKSKKQAEQKAAENAVKAI